MSYLLPFILLFANSQTPLRSEVELKKDIISLGIPARDVVLSFSHDDKVGLLLNDVADAQTTSKLKADAIYDLMQEYKRQGLWRGDKDNSPKKRVPKTVEHMAALLSKSEDGNREVGCYEFSSFFIAAARSVGVEAFGVEKSSSTGGGQIGHVMAAIRLSPGGRVWTYDLQNDSRGYSPGLRVLNDLEFAAHHYNHLAVSAFLRGDLVYASRMIAYARTLFPESASFMNNAATIHAAQGEVRLALADASAAVLLEPKKALFHYQLGRIWALQEKHIKAEASFKKALQLHPEYGIALRDLGRLKLELGELRVGTGFLERAYAADKRLPKVTLYLGLAWLRLGMLEKLNKLLLEVQNEGLHREEAVFIEGLGKELPKPMSKARLKAILREIRNKEL